MFDPTGYAGPTQPDVVITEIAGIRVTSSAVWTPAGAFPLRGSQWTVTNRWTTRRVVPRWAIVAAVLGFFVMLAFSLLFLRIRTTVVEGYVEVAVTNGPYRYSGRVPVRDDADARRIHAQVGYLRSLATT